MFLKSLVLASTGNGGKNEKIAPAPAVIATSYDISLKLDTQDDRLYEQVGIDILNDTDEAVDTVYLRYYPMGYVGYLTEARPSSAEANKDKKAEVRSVRLEGTGKELPLEYLMDNTVIKIDCSGDAIEPGESGKILVDAWTDIPDVHDRFGMVKNEKGKLYLLSFCFPYVECSSEGMWQIDPPIYLAGDGENRNPAVADYHVKIEMGEEAFYGFLSEVYRTYTNKVVHSEDILTILRSHNDSKEMNDLIAFYFKEN